MTWVTIQQLEVPRCYIEHCVSLKKEGNLQVQNLFMRQSLDLIWLKGNGGWYRKQSHYVGAKVDDRYSPSNIVKGVVEAIHKGDSRGN